MANPHKGESALVVGGRTFTMRITFDALVKIEQHFGDKGIVQVVSEMTSREGGPRLADLRFVIWQALRAEHPDMTEVAAGELLLEAMRDRSLAGVLEQALLAAFPAPPETPADPPTPSPGTGPH